MEKKLVLIDGNSIAYRAFFALPLLNNDKGIHTNAILGFNTMLNKILTDEKPTHILVAFDAGKTTFRHSTFTEYKGGRQKTPPELSEQFPYIRSLLDAYQIPYYELENYEADDIIGTLSLQAEQEKMNVKVISGDKDLTQLASDYVTVSITKKGLTDTDEYTPAFIMEKYGFTPDKIIDLKGLMGDASDNIPGVPGVGEKTALKLLTQFGTIENVLASIDEVSGAKLKEKLATNKEQAMMSKQLATILREAPITIGLDDLTYNGEDKEKLIALYKELGFHSLLEKMEVPQEEKVEQEVLEVRIVKEVSPSMFAKENALYIEMVEDNYHYADIVGISISNVNGHFYIPIEVANESEAFKQWLNDESSQKIVFDAKRSIVALNRLGAFLQGIVFDIQLAAYIINPSDKFVDFTSIAHQYGFKQISTDEAVYGKGAKLTIPFEEELSQFLATKSKALLYLYDALHEQLEVNAQIDLFYDLELPLARVLAEMEMTGIKVNATTLTDMGKELSARLTELEQKIYGLANETFNINSPKQLGVILFEKLGLPVLKKTKTGYSTAADVLERLEKDHEIVREILNYRQIGKLNSTYVEGLLKVISPKDGKIHTIYQQALTQTGRLSSTDPNLQNIPIRLEEGRKIRKAFVPSKEGWVIFAADYSQIELRVLAHIANDEKLIQAFKEDLDIHTQTAMEVFHVEKDEVTSTMRRDAKAVNFGIVYGISDFGLSQNLNISRKEANEYIERYLNSYKGVKQFMEDVVEDAKEKGYVTTLLNRRRYLPEITSRNFNLKSFAERTAMNTPIQGTAADIIKKAMIEMSAKLKEEKLQTKLLLQVHDELIFEAPLEEIERLKVLVPEVMEHAIELKVPLKVDYDFGNTWYDAK